MIKTIWSILQIWFRKLRGNMTEINSNNHEEEREDIDFCKKLETVALSCHLEVHTKIRSVFKEHEIESYQCVEFILDTPLGKDSDIQEVKISYPFLFRLINSLPFIYRIKHDKSTNLFSVTTVAKTKETLKDLRKEIRTPSKLKGHSIAEDAYGAWKSIASPFHHPICERECLLPDNVKKKIKDEDNDSRVISSDFLLSPWLLNDRISKESPFKLLQIPIATEVSFFGYFLVAYQHSGNNKTTVINDIHNKLEKIVKDIYVPTLILFYVSNWEDKLDKLNDLNNTKTKLQSQFPLKHWVYSSDFGEDEFNKVLPIGGLCNAIIDGGYYGFMQADTNTINWLNEFLKKCDSYDFLYSKNTNTSFHKNITDLVDKTKHYSDTDCSKLNNEEQNTRKRLIRLLLEKTYPQNTPEKKLNSRQNEFEAAFGKVWERRLDILNNKKEIAAEIIKKFKNTLYFHKYKIASPGMIKLIKKLISGAEQMNRPDHDGGSLPAALVYGEAGSGKDTMARLISLFTKDYCSSAI